MDPPSVCSSTGTRSRQPRTTASRSSTTPSSCSSMRASKTSSSGSPAVASGVNGRSSSRPPLPNRPTVPSTSAPARSSRSSLVRSSCCGALSRARSGQEAGPERARHDPLMELRATYRLQLGPGLDFARVRELVPYLRDLGVSHLYLSPALQAAAGSTHGYDVLDPTRVSAALGGEPALRELAAAGLGIVLDVVPNHMARSEENHWWSDPELRRRFFDIDPQTGFYRRFFDIDD